MEQMAKLPLSPSSLAADVTVGTALCDAANVLGEVVWMEAVGQNGLDIRFEIGLAIGWAN